MHTRNGSTHRRFEFMLLPGERPEDFADEARAGSCWRRGSRRRTARSCARPCTSSAAGWRRPCAPDARCSRAMRHTRCRRSWGRGCARASATRRTLAWRLDLILRGLADERCSTGYTAERRPQNEWIVNFSTEMGRVSCVLDAEAARERDAMLRASDSPPAPALPASAGGTCAPPRRRWPASCAVQGVVRMRRPRRPLQRRRRQGVRPIARRSPELPDEQASSSTASARDVVALDELEDLDGRLTAWLDEHGLEAVLIRPDALRLRRRRRARRPPRAGRRTALATGHHRIEDHRHVRVIHPKFHHVNLKTTRLQEMIDWYRDRHRVEVLFQNEFGAWMSNDAANHRIALTAFPNIIDDPEKDGPTGLHHTAFEYDQFEELNGGATCA